MTHPIYSAKYLLRKGKSYCKLIAQELGITAPEGDKRETITWVNAIVEHQSKIQPVEVEVEATEATIDYDDSITGTVEGEYVVKVGGEIIHRTRSYMKAERFIICQGYKLVSPQEVAQCEFEAELEAQVKEKEDRPEQPKIQVQEIDFGYYEVIVQSQVIATIERNFDLACWVVDGQSFDSYVDAENYVFENWERIFMSRGSGRDRAAEGIEDILYDIEDTNMSLPKGQTYAVRFNGNLAGYIWLSDDSGWTLDGSNFSDDWLPTAKKVVAANRHN